MRDEVWRDGLLRLRRGQPDRGVDHRSSGSDRRAAHYPLRDESLFGAQVGHAWNNLAIPKIQVDRGGRREGLGEESLLVAFQDAAVIAKGREVWRCFLSFEATGGYLGIKAIRESHDPLEGSRRL